MMQKTNLKSERLELAKDEREKLAYIFKKPHLQFVEANPNYHLYLVDARGERNLESILKRIDSLMENDFIKEKETITVPAIFEGYENIELENIEIVVEPNYTYNVISGCRVEPSIHFDNYVHQISWVGIINSMYFQETKKSDKFSYYFKDIGTFVDVYVPEDEQKFINKLNAMSADIRNGDHDAYKEMEQFFDLAKIARPEYVKKYKYMYDKVRESLATIHENDLFYLFGDDLKLNKNVQYVKEL